jgi:hypothetical protein
MGWMDPSPPKLWSPVLCRAVAGLDSGVFGGLLVIVWFCWSGWLRGDYWWSKLNVVGAFFFGERAFQAGFGWATLSGAALLLLIYALLGALLAWLTPAPPRWYRSVLFGLVGALVFQLAADRWLWKQFHPFAATYFPRPATLAANLIFGLSMVRLGSRNLAVLRAFGGWKPPDPPPPPDPGPPPPCEEVSSNPAATPTESAPPDC